MINITKAATEIAYDNGAVNRTTTEEQVVKHMLAGVAGLFSEDELKEVDDWLGTLSQTDFLILCVGEQGVVQAPELVESVLEILFDNM